MRPRTSTSTASALLAAAAALLAVDQAWRLAWTCDDAFISFRYAEHLVAGLGLVFNPGERVEGYSNFLWTVWVALGMRLGVEPEGWSIFWGAAFHGATVLLLGARCRARAGRSGAPAIPVAALAAAVHHDWAIHATSGLETSLFTFLSLAGFVLAVEAAGRARRLALAGAVFALAALTRPDGILMGAAAGAWVASRAALGPSTSASRRWAPAAAFWGALLAPLVPFLLARLAFYGDLVPNTFHAKSAHLAWFSQGAVYAALYFARYGALLAGPLVVAAVLAAHAARPARAARRPPEAEAAWRAEGALALALAAAFVFHVVRVGGDFMYARLLIPATPFLLVLGELAVERWTRGRPLAALAGAAALAAALVLPPHPLARRAEVAGIVDERAQYPEGRRASLRRKGEALRPWFRGLPVRVAFAGAEARVVYYARPEVAIECAAGLTDRAIARQPLARRGRVGHEKHPSAAYLIARGVQLSLSPDFAERFGLADSLPSVPIRLGAARCALLRADPDLVAALEARGARLAAARLAAAVPTTR